MPELRIDNIDTSTEQLTVNLLRSEAIQEIISRKQGFLSKWALVIFFMILLLLLLSTWLIHYPDIITAKAILTGSNAPKEIITRQEGKIIKLFTQNNDTVKEGDMLLWMEATANHQEVISLGKLLDSSIHLIDKNEVERIEFFSVNHFNHLGELQTGYQQFITAYQQFNDYLVNGFYNRKKAILESDLKGLELVNANLLQQKKITQQDIQLTQDGLTANEYLFKEKVISQQDLRAEKSKVLNRQISVPQIEASMLSNEASLREKQKEVNELNHSISQQKTIFLQAIQTLKSTLDEWKRKNIVTAPVSGKVSLVVPLQENQYVKSGKVLGYVNPSGSKYYAEVNLPQANFGKIQSGQNVQLRFDAYPYNEFGFVKGKLTYISNVSTDSGFVAQIVLPDGLMTTQKKQIQYNNGLKADALIITKDVRLLERLFNNLSKQVSR